MIKINCKKTSLHIYEYIQKKLFPQHNSLLLSLLKHHHESIKWHCYPIIIVFYIIFPIFKTKILFTLYLLLNYYCNCCLGIVFVTNSICFCKILLNETSCLNILQEQIEKQSFSSKKMLSKFIFY